MVELVPKVSTKVDFKLRFSYLDRVDHKLRPGWPTQTLPGWRSGLSLVMCLGCHVFDW
jgi:hypothetical protein